MAKFDIPKFKYLFQDEDGDVWFCITNPSSIYGEKCEWVGGRQYYLAYSGDENPNWRDTLIDLDKDDYEFEDGILRRIEK